MNKYIIKEEYQIDTDAKKEVIKGLVVTGDIPHEDYKNYKIEISDSLNRYIYHSFDIQDGEETYTMIHIETLESCMMIAEKVRMTWTNHDDLLGNSLMHLIYQGFDDCDEIDDGCMWDCERKRCAYISHTKELTEEEYLTLKKLL